MTAAAYLTVLRRRWWVLLAALVVATLGGALRVHDTTRVYVASAKDIVVVAPSSRPVDDVAAQQFLSANMPTYARLASSGEVTAGVAGALSVPSGAVHLSASVETGTFFLDVTSSSGNADTARRVADAGGQQLADAVNALQGPGGRAKARLYQPAGTPAAPAQPHVGSTLTLAVLLGAVVGVALLALVEVLVPTRQPTSH